MFKLKESLILIIQRKYKLDNVYRLMEEMVLVNHLYVANRADLDQFEDMETKYDI